jgi:hypothetical protein
VTFHNDAVNKQLAPDEFTIEKMGVQIRTRVTDRRSGEFYQYGRVAQTLKQFTTQPAAEAGDGTEGL